MEMEAIDPKATLIFKHPIDPAHISVDLALVACIEPRLWNTPGEDGKSTIDAFRQDKKWNIVFITEAGGIAIIASDDPATAERRSALFARVDQEIGLHNPKQLGLSVHLDCGAYGYSKAFGPDDAKERTKLYADLRKAADRFRERFGDRVKGFVFYIFTFEGVEEIIL